MANNTRVKAIAALILLSIFYSAETATLTPVERHGWLTAKYGYLYNEHNVRIQLRGMSFDLSESSNPGSKFYTAENVDKLATEWKCSVVRAVYKSGSDDSCWIRFQTVVDQAIKRGIYVIADLQFQSASLDSYSGNLLAQLALAYKHSPNVIFELQNDSLTSDKSGDVSVAAAKQRWPLLKAFITSAGKILRDQGAQNLILSGTPYNHVQIAAVDTIPLTNIAYTFHFSAASHGPFAINVKESGTGGMEAEYLTGALGRITVFITKWETANENSNPPVDSVNTQWWFNNYLNGKYHPSWCNWSVSDNKASSAFTSEGMSSFSESGKIVYKLFTAAVIDSFPDTDFPIGNIFTVPATIPAWKYSQNYGANIVRQAVSFSQRDDRSSVRNAKDSCIKVYPGSTNEFVSYNVDALKKNDILGLRCLTTNGGGKIEVSLDSKSIDTITISRQEGWHTFTVPCNIDTGMHKLMFKFTEVVDTGFGIEWLDFSERCCYDPPIISVIPSSVKMMNTNIVFSHGLLRYSFPNDIKGILSVKIFDITGKEIVNRSFKNHTENEIVIPTSSFPSGVYSVVTYVNGTQYGKAFSIYKTK